MHLYENAALWKKCLPQKIYSSTASIKMWSSWTRLSVKSSLWDTIILAHCLLVKLLFKPPLPQAPLSSSHQGPSSEIIPVGWGHVAEPVRLNPNQFLSDGHRKEPNRVYPRLIQSACGRREDDCAIMSSQISFLQAGRQTDGQACSVGWVLEGCPLLPAMEEVAQRQISCLSKVSREKTPGQNPGLEGQGEIEMWWDRGS